jgi:hypothetical protein
MPRDRPPLPLPFLLIVGAGYLLWRSQRNGSAGERQDSRSGEGPSELREDAPVGGKPKRHKAPDRLDEWGMKQPVQYLVALLFVGFASLSPLVWTLADSDHDYFTDRPGPGFGNPIGVGPILAAVVFYKAFRVAQTLRRTA